VLVNNLGYYEGTNVAETDDETWDRVLAVNLRSPIATSRAAAPYLAKSRGGNIINAPHTGAVIRIDSLSSFANYAGARRYLSR